MMETVQVVIHRCFVFLLCFPNCWALLLFHPTSLIFMSWMYLSLFWVYHCSKFVSPPKPFLCSTWWNLYLLYFFPLVSFHFVDSVSCLVPFGGSPVLQYICTTIGPYSVQTTPLFLGLLVCCFFACALSQEYMDLPWYSRRPFILSISSAVSSRACWSFRVLLFNLQRLYHNHSDAQTNVHRCIIQYNCSWFIMY